MFTKRKNNIKGNYGYAAYKKIKDLILTVFMFVLSLGLFVIGRIVTGTNKNLLTIVAVVGLLPACKMLVGFIMSMRVKSCAPELKVEIDAALGDLTGFYHLYFTSLNINFPTIHVTVTDNLLVGLGDDSFKEKEFEAHIKELMNREGIGDVNIKIFKDKDKYLARLGELNTRQSAASVNKALVRLLMDVSL